MKENLENLDLQFWKWFPQGIKNPSKINYYLNQRSDWLDHKIINRFEELELHKNFGLFAIGGYGKKEDEIYENKIMSNVLKEVVLDKELS